MQLCVITQAEIFRICIKDVYTGFLRTKRSNLWSIKNVIHFMKNYDKHSLPETVSTAKTLQFWMSVTSCSPGVKGKIHTGTLYLVWKIQIIPMKILQFYFAELCKRNNIYLPNQFVGIRITLQVQTFLVKQVSNHVNAFRDSGETIQRQHQCFCKICCLGVLQYFRVS